MSVRDPYIVSPNPNLHLRDARHAHQFFTEHGHLFAPKTKFLYHVVFQPFTGPNGIGDATTSNSVKFQKEIGVLAKSVELPQFRANVENKQQYNRKKNVQTRIDYQEVTIRFHDDNAGLTRSLLEEYYKYYVADGHHDLSSNAFDPRDKYNMNLPKYGLDNNKTIPFFSYIKIYQLSKQQWFSYTLVNPLITQWGHDTLDASDNSGMMENVIAIAYESVVYDHGVIDGSEPVGFTDAETRYDNVSSPLALPEDNGATIYNQMPTLNSSNSTVPRGLLPRMSNSDSEGPSSGITPDDASPLRSSLPYEFPRPQQDQNNRIFSNVETRLQLNDPEALVRELDNNPSAKESFLARSLNAGEAGDVNYSVYNQLDTSSKQSVVEQLVSGIKSGSRKITSFAQDALNRSKEND